MQAASSGPGAGALLSTKLKVHLSRRTFTINDDFHLRLNERVYSSKQSVGAMHTTHPDLKREKTNPVGGIPAINHKTDNGIEIKYKIRNLRYGREKAHILWTYIDDYRRYTYATYLLPCRT